MDEMCYFLIHDIELKLQNGEFVTCIPGHFAINFYLLCQEDLNNNNISIILYNVQKTKY